MRRSSPLPPPFRPATIPPMSNVRAIGRRTQHRACKRVSAGECRYFTYNDVNLVTTIEYPGGAANYFWYDAMMRRYAMQDSSGLRYFTWDQNGMNLLCERDAAGSVSAYYTHGYTPVPGVGTMITAKRNEAGTSYYQFPVYGGAGEGDVVRLVDENGNATAYYEYDAWGNFLREDVVAGTGTNRFRANSNYVDLPDSGGTLDLSGTRVRYKPIGRWLQRDPIDRLLGGYDYASSSPTVYVDPRGQAPVVRAQFVANWLKGPDFDLSLWYSSAATLASFLRGVVVKGPKFSREMAGGYDIHFTAFAETEISGTLNCCITVGVTTSWLQLKAGASWTTQPRIRIKLRTPVIYTAQAGILALAANKATAKAAFLLFAATAGRAIGVLHRKYAQAQAQFAKKSPRALCLLGLLFDEYDLTITTEKVEIDQLAAYLRTLGQEQAASGVEKVKRHAREVNRVLSGEDFLPPRNEAQRKQAEQAARAAEEARRTFKLRELEKVRRMGTDIEFLKQEMRKAGVVLPE